MLARIAHELFWLGRNLARAEHTARDARRRLPGEPAGPRRRSAGVAARLELDPGDHGRRSAGEGPIRRDDVLRAPDARRHASRRRSSPASPRAREGARTVRDVITAEMWESINTTDLRLGADDIDGPAGHGPLLASTTTSRSAARSFWGLTSRTMLRDEARAFLVARRADRVRRHGAADAARRDADRDARRGDGAVSDGQALALLQAVGGFQAFRRAVPAPPNAGPVTRFLLYERAYPDSVAASVDALHESLRHGRREPAQLRAGAAPQPAGRRPRVPAPRARARTPT